MLRPSFLLLNDEKGTRIDRRGFWTWSLLWLAVLAATLVWKAGLDTDWDVLVSFLLFGCSAGLWTALGIGRLHDLGYSGWWAAVFLCIFFFLGGLGKRPLLFAGLAVFLLSLGFAPSQAAANRYGPWVRSNGDLWR